MSSAGKRRIAGRSSHPSIWSRRWRRLVRLAAAGAFVAALVATQPFAQEGRFAPGGARPAAIQLGDDQPATGQFVLPGDASSHASAPAVIGDGRTGGAVETPRTRLGSPRVGSPAFPGNLVEPAQATAPRSEVETGPTPRVLQGHADTAPPASSGLTGAMANPRPPTNNLAATLLERALMPPRERALRGKPLPLVEALSHSSPSGRALLIKRYWQASMKIAEYHSALDELARVLALPTPQAADQKGVLLGAHAAARARLDETEAQAVSSQFELAESLSGWGEAPPWPTEIPLAASYRTQFETIYPGGRGPASLRQLHEALPFEHKALQSRAEAVIAAEDGEGEIESAFRRGTTDINGVLLAHEAIRAQRKYFFRMALQYNLDVAEYALAVVGAEAAPGTLVSTLVETPIVATQPTMRSVSVGTDAEIVQTAGAFPIGHTERQRTWQRASAPPSRYPALGEGDRSLR